MVRVQLLSFGVIFALFGVFIVGCNCNFPEADESIYNLYNYQLPVGLEQNYESDEYNSVHDPRETENNNGENNFYNSQDEAGIENNVENGNLGEVADDTRHILRRHPFGRVHSRPKGNKRNNRYNYHNEDDKKRIVVQPIIQYVIHNYKDNTGPGSSENSNFNTNSPQKWYNMHSQTTATVPTSSQGAIEIGQEEQPKFFIPPSLMNPKPSLNQVLENGKTVSDMIQSLTNSHFNGGQYHRNKNTKVNFENHLHTDWSIPGIKNKQKFIQSDHSNDKPQYQTLVQPFSVKDILNKLTGAAWNLNSNQEYPIAENYGFSGNHQNEPANQYNNQANPRMLAQATGWNPLFNKEFLFSFPPEKNEKAIQLNFNKATTQPMTKNQVDSTPSKTSASTSINSQTGDLVGSSGLEISPPEKQNVAPRGQENGKAPEMSQTVQTPAQNPGSTMSTVGAPVASVSINSNQPNQMLRPMRGSGMREPKRRKPKFGGIRAYFKVLVDGGIGPAGGMDNDVPNNSPHDPNIDNIGNNGQTPNKNNANMGWGPMRRIQRRRWG